MNEKERIEYIMRCYNLTPSQFADRAGIQRASVSHILSGRNKASLEVLLKIYDSFPELDMAWLMTGKGAAPAVEHSPAEQKENVPLIMPELFSQAQEVPVVETHEPEQPQKLQKSVAAKLHPAERAPRRAASRVASQAAAAPVQRKIKEIRIFYTDGTYETMIPER